MKIVIYHLSEKKAESRQWKRAVVFASSRRSTKKLLFWEMEANEKTTKASLMLFWHVKRGRMMVLPFWIHSNPAKMPVKLLVVKNNNKWFFHNFASLYFPPHKNTSKAASSEWKSHHRSFNLKNYFFCVSVSVLHFPVKQNEMKKEAWDERRKSHGAGL